MVYCYAHFTNILVKVFIISLCLNQSADNISKMTEAHTCLLLSGNPKVLFHGLLRGHNVIKKINGRRSGRRKIITLDRDDQFNSCSETTAQESKRTMR